MTDLVLARKYRSRRFDDMVGQQHVVQALTHALAQGRLHHAYLFTGTRGIGKTTISRILAKCLNCTGADGQGGITTQPCGQCTACREIDADRYIDYIEMDAASNRSIDEIRDLIERAAYKPSVGRYKVFMIDEAHQLTKDAFNALLKTLEEPPEYLKFVLATTDPEKMLPTVLSRCLHFALRPMQPDVIEQHVAQVLAAEGLAFEPGALRLIGRAARGSMRDALSLTDQAIAYGGGAVREAEVRTMLGAVDRRHAEHLIEALAARDGRAVLAHCEALRAQGLSAMGTLDEIARLAQQMAVQQAVPGALPADDDDAQAALRLAPLLAPDETQLLYSLCLQGRAELALAPDEHAGLVMTLLRYLAFPPADGSSTRVLPAAVAAPPTQSAQRPVAAAPVAPTPPLVAAPPPPAAPPATATALDARWAQAVETLLAQDALRGLARELAVQTQLTAVEGAQWQLTAPRAALCTAAAIDALQTALAALLGEPVQLAAGAGEVSESHALREARRQAARQAQAEARIEGDALVQAVLAQYDTARIVPGSIKPI
ncbi:MAG: DNA polymerase III subunit gamma/tau [Proteobacteria bacterium]|nr:DNA polymerase III subunit gamma/tau [Pseudomonadota bacterium]